MMKKHVLAIWLLLASGYVTAAPGDTTWVQAQKNVWLDWYNNFDTAVQFPDGNTSYRKIQMTFTLGKYVCPNSPQYCADWDYTVQVFIMTPGGDTLELGKLITPYAKGARMPADWKKDYVFDVTDYYPVLKNKGTVRVFYSGYSGGFTADVRFAFISGTRERDVLRIDRLWHGGFDYGSPSQPIENSVAAVTRSAPSGTAQTELKFNITGHGGDDVNCAEFCRKDYRVMLNNAVAARRSVWRDDCGLNNLYPQSGTWIYDRANWCPGDLVRPHVHRLSGITPGTPFSIDVDFDAHTSTTNLPNRYQARYIIEAALFYYGQLNNNLDVAVEDVIAPTDADNHFRENAMCGKPAVRIRNTGSTAVTSVRFAYGVNGSVSEHLWQGTLAAQEETEVVLPELYELRSVSGQTGQQTFSVRIREVNGTADADATNNELKTTFTPAPKWPLRFIVSLRTNRSVSGGVSQTGWAIYNIEGKLVKERNNLAANTAYTDTVSLDAGCYRLEVKDAGCDGLSWWANSGAGNGTFTVRPLTSVVPYNLRGYFNGDFGCGFTQYFTTEWPVSVQDMQSVHKAGLDIYPNPARQYVQVSVTGDTRIPGTIRVLDISGRVVALQPYNGSAPVSINTSSFANGMYTVVFASDSKDTIRVQGRFLVNRAD